MPDRLYLVTVIETATYLVPIMAPLSTPAVERAVALIEAGLADPERAPALRETRKTERVYSSYVVRGDGKAGP